MADFYVRFMLTGLPFFSFAYISTWGGDYTTDLIYFYSLDSQGFYFSS